MMDTQRLIALIVFSFSALLLWDAWQKHNAPKVPPAPAATTAAAGIPAPSSTLSAPGIPTASPTPQASPGAPPVPAAPVATAQAAGEPIVIRTDLFEIELNTAGGDIRRVTMLQQHSAKDRAQPLTLLEPNPKHFFVTQTGLLGENSRTTRPRIARTPAASRSPREGFTRGAARGATAAARKSRSVHVPPRLLRVVVTYEIANRSDKPSRRTRTSSSCATAIRRARRPRRPAPSPA
jgi:YidC/Oxa1 family membrane protein insertase